MTDETNTATEAKVTKSIVPARYAGRYKGGGSDALAAFINEQCKDDKGNFSFDRFWDLCTANGIADAEVNKYKVQVEDKVNGAAGRARMTLRNRLAAIIRKTGKAVDMNGDEQDLDVPSPTAKKEAA